MTPEIRCAALRMAAKTALIASLGAGCANRGPSAPPPIVNTTQQAPPVVDELCEVYLAKLAVVEREALAADDPLRARSDVYGAFSDVRARKQPRTRQCCHDELAGKLPTDAQRWACCSALDEPDGLACTPWGPNCPPEMTA